MASTFISPFNRDDRIDAERYVLRDQDIMEAAHSMRENRIQRTPVIDPFTYMTTTAETTINHQIADIHKRMAQFEKYGQAEFRRISGDHASLITRVDQLLHQVEHQNAAILELSRIIDELKQDGFQPLEPLEDVD